jgi:RHS repeat-associated protein
MRSVLRTGTDDRPVSARAWGSKPVAPPPPPPIEQPFRFQGQQFDEETGLHYNRFRYYDPKIGRFVSQDPIGFEGDINFYFYTIDPLQYTDVYGLMPKKAASKVALPDGAGASPQDIANSKIGGGTRKGQQECRDKLIAAANGVYTCWRCGQTSTNAADMHLGHKNVPTSKGGNLDPVNTELEGASCNLSAGNSGYVKDGMSCKERGSCGATYGR